MPATRHVQIAALRRFSRFYTRQIGVLRKSYLDSQFSLGEARVLYEIAHGDRLTASDIASRLDLDPGYLSRLLRNFEKQKLIDRKASAQDARQSHLTLTPRGKRAFAPLEKCSQQQAGSMLGKLKPAEQAELVTAMKSIQSLLDAPAARAAQPILRQPKPGDFGWVVTRHAQLYRDEYGWTEPFEGLCAQIVADFVNKFDPAKERAWIAEVDGENAGSIMLVKDSDEVARIRLLLVDPKARGLRLGAKLTEESIKFARAAGYKKVTLWTHSILTAARHVYKNAGFQLTRTEPHTSWGKPVIGEHWDLEL
jgi:DNA-binding MarR family transcriptional regulator/N-acetylglutamate synthase-like GNAT family acetyltransferase